jgi:hypothetical protein
MRLLPIVVTPSLDGLFDALDLGIAEARSLLVNIQVIDLAMAALAYTAFHALFQRQPDLSFGVNVLILVIRAGLGM